MKRALAVAVVLILAAGIGTLARSIDPPMASRPGAGPALISGSEAGVRSQRAPSYDLIQQQSGQSGDGAGVPAPAPAFGEEADFAEGSDGISAGASTGITLGAPGPVAGGPKVVKTAAITVTLEEGDFEGAFQEASLVASRRGGFIASSSTSKGDEFRSGTLVIRVPANVFDQALADLRELGEVIGEEASGEDVTATFVDLQARLRNWEAQETVLLRLMSQASTIDESIKVQRNLSDVQLEIERIRGQLRLLRDQTDMGTISLTLAEGDAIAKIEEEKEQGTLVKAWNDAVDGFLGVIAATVVGLGYLIPIGLLLMLGWLIFRRVRPVAVPSEL